VNRILPGPVPWVVNDHIINQGDCNDAEGFGERTPVA
jgi:hypothetical protein